MFILSIIYLKEIIEHNILTIEITLKYLKIAYCIRPFILNIHLKII